MDDIRSYPIIGCAPSINMYLESRLLKSLTLETQGGKQELRTTVVVHEIRNGFPINLFFSREAPIYGCLIKKISGGGGGIVSLAPLYGI